MFEFKRAVGVAAQRPSRRRLPLIAKPQIVPRDVVSGACRCRQNHIVPSNGDAGAPANIGRVMAATAIEIARTRRDFGFLESFVFGARRLIGSITFSHFPEALPLRPSGTTLCSNDNTLYGLFKINI